MSKLSSGFYKLFNTGFTDELVGLPCLFSKLESVLYGFQRSRYWLVGGQPGTGKTSFVDDMFVLSIFDWWYENYNCDESNFKISWIYNSMERNKDLKIAKWASMKLYKEEGVIVSAATMIGATKKLTKPELVKENEVKIQYKDKIEGYKKYFAEMEKHVTIYGGAINPTGIIKRCRSFAKLHGEYTEDGYKSNHQNHYVFVINDHVGKLKTESGLGDKGILDLHSQYMGDLRDNELFIPIDIYQFNRSMADSMRKKNEDMYPRLEDFKGTGDGTENADHVLGLFEPLRYNIKEFNGYDVDSFVSNSNKNRFRSVSVLKNSYGENDLDFGFGFMGEMGKFYELPTAKELVKPSKRSEIDKLLRIKDGK